MSNAAIITYLAMVLGAVLYLAVPALGPAPAGQRLAELGRLMFAAALLVGGMHLAWGHG